MSTTNEMLDESIILSVNHIHVQYGAIKALKGISLRVPKGKIISLIGANGAGKTTTLNAISGRVRVHTGEINYQGKDYANRAPHLMNQAGVVLVPEGRKIFPDLTVKENLLMGAYHRKDKDGIRRDMEWCFHLFPRLKERITQAGGTLSGGEQQMLAISRGLMSRPKVLMLDEPSLGLAPLLVSEVFSVIRQINEEDGVTLLLVEQNAAQALKTAHYGYVLETGAITLEGPAQSLLSNEKVKYAYLGI